MWTVVTQIYSILLIYLLTPCPTPNPTYFLFFSFFLPFSLNQKSQPYTFCNTQLNSRVKKKKGRGGVRYFKEPHVWPHLPHSPQPHISQESSLSWPATHLFFFFFFFFHTTNTSFYHSLISFNNTHSIASPPPLENSIGKR